MNDEKSKKSTKTWKYWLAVVIGIMVALLAAAIFYENFIVRTISG